MGAAPCNHPMGKRVNPSMGLKQRIKIRRISSVHATLRHSREFSSLGRAKTVPMIQ